jgi:hypothetical protein
MLAHGRDQHLAPVLTEVLAPAVVIARYSDAARAAAAIPGPWQPEGGLTLTGRTPSQAAIAARAPRSADSWLVQSASRRHVIQQPGRVPPAIAGRCVAG